MNKTEKKSMLCPNCRKLISYDEPHCPYCGLSKPGAFWKKRLSIFTLKNPDDMIRFIIFTNIGLFIVSLLLNPTTLSFGSNPLTFLSPSNNSLLLLGATGTIPIDQLHRWWTLVSASYIHGGILHIFFNMIALNQLGPFVMQEYGVSRFFAIYTLTGIAGFVVSYLAGIPLTIGASASICGLIGAALYYGKSRGGVYGQSVYRHVMGWVIGLMFFGFLVPGINNWGHGGGIAAGLLLGYFFGYHEKKKENFTHLTLSIVCILLTVAILSWAVIQSVYYRFII